MRRAAVFILSLFLVLIYLALDHYSFSMLRHWQTMPPLVYQQQQEVLREIYRYAANSIFDPGYQREIGSELHQRLSVYPNNAAEKVWQLQLPSGFRGGFLSFKTTAQSGYRVGISADLKHWQLTDFPGHEQEMTANLNLASADFPDGIAYLKILPAANSSLNIDFDIFQYLADQPADFNQYQGHFLFLPETDIDDQGQEIIQPGVLYEK